MKTLFRLIHAGFEFQIVVFRIDGGNMIAQGMDSQILFLTKTGTRTQTVQPSTLTVDGNLAWTKSVRDSLVQNGHACEFWNKGSDGGQFEDIEVTEIILGVGESYDVLINLPDINNEKAYEPIIVRLFRGLFIRGPFIRRLFRT